jgi:carboxylesterase type B
MPLRSSPNLALALAAPLLLLLCLSCSIAAASSAPPVVHGLDCNDSAVGVWETHTDSQTNASRRVASFRGIRFATAARFAEPVPRTGAACGAPRTINATAFGSICAQLTLGLLQPAQLVGSEECLFLNVYLPQRVLASGRLAPVFVMIPGGSFVFGGGSEEKLGLFGAFSTSDGAGGGADDRGVVIVTINFRLSILAWAAFRSLPAFNLGVLDQVLALKWVQRNIAAFLGDPTRVTIGGQSSGGTNCLALLACPSAAGLFRGVLAMSPSPNVTMDLPTKLKQDLPLLQKTGCGGKPTAAEELACLRGASLQTLFAAVNSTPEWYWNTPHADDLGDLRPSGRSFIGIIFVDGQVITQPLLDALRGPPPGGANASGNVSLVMTNMAQESNMELPTLPSGMSLREWRAALRHMFRRWNSTAGEAARVAEEVYTAYEAEAIESPLLAYTSIQTDMSVTCAAGGVLARAAAQNPRFHRVYVSVNQYPPATPNQPGAWRNYAYHLFDWTCATEMWLILGFIKYSPQPSDFALGKLLRSQYHAFFSTGTMSGVQPAWLPVSAGQPVSTFVYARKDRFPHVDSATVSDYKASQCEVLVQKVGLGQNFWWCN